MRLVLSHRGRWRSWLLAVVGGLELLNKTLHFQGIPLAVAVTFHRARTTGRLNIDITEDNAGIDAHRGDVGNMDGMFAPAEQLRPVLNDGTGRDLDLSGKEVIAGAETARPEDVTGRERTPFSPDDKRNDQDDRDNGERCNKPGRLKVELFHEGVMLS